MGTPEVVSAVSPADVVKVTVALELVIMGLPPASTKVTLTGYTVPVVRLSLLVNPEMDNAAGVVLATMSIEAAPVAPVLLSVIDTVTSPAFPAVSVVPDNKALTLLKVPLKVSVLVALFVVTVTLPADDVGNPIRPDA